MVVGMQKKVLTEQSIYFGDVSMPKDWEIDQDELSHHILHSNLTCLIVFDIMYINTKKIIRWIISIYLLHKKMIC